MTIRGRDFRTFGKAYSISSFLCSGLVMRIIIYGPKGLVALVSWRPSCIRTFFLMCNSSNI